MYTDADGMYVWERHALPTDWPERLLRIVPDGPMAPVIAATQEIVRRHGEMSIILWQVQELALLTCGHDRPRFRDAYEPVCTRLIEIAGADWPLTATLAEHLRGEDQVMQFQKRFLACEGEWLSLMRLSDAGWLPQYAKRAAREPDWIVAKNGVQLRVEVKTKLPLATTAGRLTRAFIGLGMLSRFAFLRELDYTWYEDDDLNDATASNFLQVFLMHAETIANLGRRGQITRQVLESELGTLRVTVRAQRYFRVELLRTKDDGSGTRRVVFEAAPAAVPDHIFTGGGSVRTASGPDVELRAAGTALKRLIRPKQMQQSEADTLFHFIWHMPFHAMSYDCDRLTVFWQEWCADNGIVRGVLQPITPGGSFFSSFVTDAARDLGLTASG